MQFLQKKEKEREKISSASCHTRHLSSMQHNRLPHWAFGSWSIELSAVLAKGAWSDDGANYCIHNVFLFFFSHKVILFEWGNERNQVSYLCKMVFRSAYLLLPVGLIITGIGNTAKCLIIFDQFTLLWDFPQSPQKN